MLNLALWNILSVFNKHFLLVTYNKSVNLICSVLVFAVTLILHLGICLCILNDKHISSLEKLYVLAFNWDKSALYSSHVICCLIVNSIHWSKSLFFKLKLCPFLTKKGRKYIFDIWSNCTVFILLTRIARYCYSNIIYMHIVCIQIIRFLCFFLIPLPQ